MAQARVAREVAAVAKPVLGEALAARAVRRGKPAKAALAGKVAAQLSWQAVAQSRMCEQR